MAEKFGKYHDFNKEVAHYMHEYLRIPITLRDNEGFEENLSFNQLLGKALLDTMDRLEAINMDGTLYRNSEEPSDDKAAEAMGLAKETDPMLKDQYKYESQIDGIVRYLKECGYKFKANLMIEVGLETKRLDQWFRAMDCTGVEIPKPKAPVRTNHFKRDLGFNVTHLKNASRHEVIYSRTSGAPLSLRYDLKNDTLHIRLDPDDSLEDFAIFKEALETTIPTKLIQPNKDAGRFTLNGKPELLPDIMAFLVQNRDINAVPAKLFEDAVLEHRHNQAQDLGL